MLPGRDGSVPASRTSELGGQELQSWAAKKIGNIKAQLLMAKEVILQLDRARDRRDLSLEEIELQRQLKGLCLGLASLARIHHRETKI